LLRALLHVNKNSWDEYIPHVEFSYNRVVHWTTNISPFEVVCGFNPLTPLDLLHLPDTSSLLHKEGVSKAEFVKKFRKKIKSQIEH